ncbi:DNA-binding response regulator [Paenibacillus baekrokdamisoli]|uniref:DNA-binding response regulator n=1 Tax=Paenibacillus baekrokdamisoli TaxID=1712516 RepID=A0A3G9JIE1_9BACL|nr:response regulator transcription factor [Paenibacillus baekrokdamisoli]MBB3068166.1 two-component system response regulator VanR [Paenibacillus baekrokdamisoli]BBH22789.1 DNA-binding response regulator [Paenibacillus baekrokdamisoli]
MPAKILVVEDDHYIQELISEFLRAQQYEVDAASDGLEGWNLFQQQPYDLVILDLMLPSLDGYSICRMIREKSETPVIVMTALSEEKDQLRAFEEEADDYVTKPFSFQVLIKRVEAVLRRTKHVQSGELPFDDRLRLDVDAYKVYVEGRFIETTTKEFDILQTLLSNAGRIMTRDMLLDKVWGYDYFGDSRIVDAHIKNIRKKLGIPIIRTVKGVGYALENEMVGVEG